MIQEINANKKVIRFIITTFINEIPTQEITNEVQKYNKTTETLYLTSSKGI